MQQLQANHSRFGNPNIQIFQICFQKKYSILYLLTCCCEPGFGILNTAPESFLHLSISVGWFQWSDLSPFTIKTYLRHVVTTPEIHASLGEKGQVAQENENWDAPWMHQVYKPLKLHLRADSPLPPLPWWRPPPFKGKEEELCYKFVLPSPNYTILYFHSILASKFANNLYTNNTY